MLSQTCVYPNKDNIWLTLSNHDCEQEKTVICKNPLKNKKFTLYEYNNWLNTNPKFTYGHYKKYSVNTIHN